MTQSQRQADAIPLEIEITQAMLDAGSLEFPTDNELDTGCVTSEDAAGRVFAAMLGALRPGLVVLKLPETKPEWLEVFLEAARQRQMLEGFRSGAQKD